jgi:hypothetical protein
MGATRITQPAEEIVADMLQAATKCLKARVILEMKLCLDFDFPLDELKTYKGINPRPNDFDQYWKKHWLRCELLTPRQNWYRLNFRHPG